MKIETLKSSMLFGLILLLDRGTVMNDKNTESLRTYIFYNILYSFCALIWYRLVFRLIPGRTYIGSKTMLYVLVFFCVFTGIVLTHKRRRNSISTLVNIAIPFEMYTLITYFSEFRTLSIILMIISCGLGITYIILLLKRKMPVRVKREIVIRKRVQKGLLGTRTIAAIIMLAMLIPVGTSLFLTDSILPNTETVLVGIEAEDCTIANNIETVRNNRQEIWKDLSVSDKMRTLQVIANIEARYLGLPHELNVQIESLDDGTIAHYVDSTHSISLNINYFNRDATEIVESLCHEAYHAYQHRLIEAYDSLDDDHKHLLAFAGVENFKYEFANYNHESDDFWSYYYQWCEVSARSYSADAITDYMDRIEEYEVHDGQRDN